MKNQKRTDTKYLSWFDNGLMIFPKKGMIHIKKNTIIEHINLSGFRGFYIDDVRIPAYISRQLARHISLVEDGVAVDSYRIEFNK